MFLTIDIQVRGQGSDPFRDADERVDSWLTDLVDDTVDYAAQQLKVHAPGGIKDLVTTDGPEGETQIGAIEGMAGVLPDLQEEIDHPRGIGSSPADYPFFVDVGTGVYGEYGTPITSFPGHVMGPVEFGERMIYLESVVGQRGQHYSDAAHRDVDEWLPVKIQQEKTKLSI